MRCLKHLTRWEWQTKSFMGVVLRNLYSRYCNDLLCHYSVLRFSGKIFDEQSKVFLLFAMKITTILKRFRVKCSTDL